MSSTLEEVSLGKVTNIILSKSEVFAINPRILQDSESTIVTSTSGALQNIKIHGVFTASNISGLKTAYEAIEALIDGNQGATLTLVVDIEGITMWTGEVIIEDFTWKYDISTRAIIDYSLSLVEGTFGE